MSKQFTIITKDGSKWLQPTNVPYPNADEYEDGNEPHPYAARADAVIYEERTRPLPYLGDKPEGTTLDESEVRKVIQVEDYPGWITPHPDNLVDWLETSHETRSAYVDVEPSHDCQVSDNPRYPLFKHMSDEHGLTLLDSEMDEISHACKLLTGAEYWEKRALAAEKLIEMEPSNPKTYDEFCRLRDEWHELKNQEPK